MSDSREKEILALAVEKGFISQSDIALAQQQAGDGSSPLKFLVSVNLIDEEIIERLRLELMQYRDTFSLRISEHSLDGNATILPSERKSSAPRGELGGKLSSELLPDGRTRRFELSSDAFGDQLKILQSDSDFPLNWERYSYVRFLGEGGMGRVFLAMDPRLKRYVAIKFVRGSDANSAERFLNEAQAQARVTHDNLCKVYEVGEVDGRPFIVMQFVEGLALNHLPHDLGLEQKLMLIRDVADALHQAHRSGLIHRDIKPSNIIVEHTSGQGYRPVVLDFGLARQQSTPGMTVTGSVIGTPHYMPPEQARGEIHALDRRGDVYSVGATMYELLCGEQPFSGSTSINVLFQVINEDPQSLRSKNALIPPDVETICFKCMEKNPEKRYESARALAEDISRYLDGEPIQARRTSLWYQLSKKAAKHKLTVITAAVACAMLIAVLTWSWVQQSRVRAQAQLALQFGQEVQEMEDDLRKIYLIPLHDIRPHRKLLEKRMAIFRARMNDVGILGLGPGNYALGSAYLALEQYENARSHLELSWNSGFRKSEVAYALGRVMGTIFQRELSRIRQITDPEEQARARKTIEKEYREPALAFLALVPRDNLDSPEYIEALLAFYAGEYSRALQRSEAAFARNPWFYEALILEGNVYKVRADDSFNSGEYISAQADYAAAEAAYVKAARVGESDPAVYLAQAELAESRMVLSIYGQQGELGPHFQAGVEACNLAMEADSNNVHTYLISSSLYLRMAENLRTSEEAMSMLRKGIELAEKSLVMSKVSPDVYSQLGRAYGLLAEALERHGEEPGENYRKSQHAYDQAIAKDPSYRNFNRMGLLLKEVGFSEMKRGRNPSASWLLAGDAFESARRVDPTKFGACNNLGELRYQQGYYELANGQDPTVTLEKAVEAYRSALEINPQAKNSWNGLGDVFNLRASYILETGHRCKDGLEQALIAFHNALDNNRDYARASQGLAETYFWLGVESFSFGGLGEEYLTQAMDAIDDAIKLEPKNYRPQMSKGAILSEDARQKIVKGVDGSVSLRNALDAYRKADQLSPNHADLAISLARTYALKARQKLRGKQDPDAEVRICLEYLQKASELDSSGSKMLLIKGDALLIRARWQASRGRDPRATFLEVGTILEQSNALGGFLESRLAMARCNLYYYLWLRQSGKDLKGLNDLLKPVDELLEKNPDFPEGLALKGMILGVTARTSEESREAEALVQRAQKANANLAFEIKSVLGGL